MSHPINDPGNYHCRSTHKEVVAQRLRVSLISHQCERGFLSGMRQERVHRTQYDIGTISAGHRNVSRHNPRYRMKSHPLKQHGGNGKQNNITAVTNDVRQQSEDNHPQDNFSFLFPVSHSQTDARIDKSGMLGHTQSEHGDNHHAKRSKTGKVLDSIPQPPADSLRAQQALHPNILP